MGCESMMWCGGRVCSTTRPIGRFGGRAEKKEASRIATVAEDCRPCDHDGRQLDYPRRIREQGILQRPRIASAPVPPRRELCSTTKNRLLEERIDGVSASVAQRQKDD